MKLPLALLVSLSLSACNTGLPGHQNPPDGGMPADAMISALCMTAESHSDFPWIHQFVFQRSCSFSSCHSGSNPQAKLKLDLDGGMAVYDHLVTSVPLLVCSTQRGQRLVDPGNPDNSYLLVKLGGVPGDAGIPEGFTNDAGVVAPSYMPQGNPRLCNEKIGAVRRWIQNLGDAGVGAPVCCDAVTNGDETDQDCGGSCLPCADGKMCGAPSDCASGVCTMNVCQAATCTDTIKNEMESDVDCGGNDTPPCPRCADGLHCKTLGDCMAGSKCQGSRCVPATCTDGMQNAGESDKDCGGMTLCQRCASGKMCTADTDCVSGSCDTTMNKCL